MRIMTLVLGALLLALAAAPAANALVHPEWVVVRWANADCKIWHNDTNAPAGYGWQPVAFASIMGRSALEDGAALSNARLRIARTRRWRRFRPAFAGRTFLG